MGDAKDEAATLNDFERVKTENLLKAADRDAELEKYRDSQNGGAEDQSEMVADPEPAGVGWPDSEVHAGPSGFDKVAGALRVGKAGDAAFAHDLLSSGQAPPGGVGKPEAGGDGAREHAGGTRAANPALGLG